MAPVRGPFFCHIPRWVKCELVQPADLGSVTFEGSNPSLGTDAPVAELEYAKDLKSSRGLIGIGNELKIHDLLVRVQSGGQ